MRKMLASCLAVLLLFTCGCAAGQRLPAGAYRNDIAVMRPVSQEKTEITIRAEYNVNNEALRSALEKQFPQADFVSVFHCSQETQYELRQSLLGNSAEDIVISPNMKAVSDIAPQSLLDLSAEDFTNNYIGSSLEGCQINGKLFYLPGPSSLYGIIYDKTLFAQRGWKVPHSCDEFIRLVRTIEASGIRAFQPTCKYARQAQMIFTMFAYEESFHGIQNYRWMTDYQSGLSSMKGHLEPALSRYRELQEAGAIAPKDFDMQPGNRSTMMYTDHACAMIVENEQAQHYAEQFKSDHQYGMFPFWCGNKADSDFLMSLPSYYVGLSVRLADKGNEQKLALAKKILRYISTPDGQLAASGGKMVQISNVLNTPYAKNDFNAEIQDTIRKGNLVPEVELLASGNNNPVEKALQADLRKLLEGSLSESDLMAHCDSVRDKSLSSGLDRGKKVGTAEKSFTPLETGLFIADALKKKAGADIGLCLVGTTHCGMVGRIYQGDLYEADVRSLSLSVGVTSKDPNDKKLWLVSMTGEQLTELLKEACRFDPNDNVPNIPYYVASGLKIRFAPWKEDKLLSVALDGGELQKEKTYRVALWGWPFAKPCSGRVEKVFDDSCDDILTAAIRSAGPLSPAGGDRFSLVY